MTLCKNCHLEIKQITDPWGDTSHAGIEYPWYHVEATDNADGQYIEECPDDSGEVAEPEILCDKCEERPATHEGQELINSEMGFKQYGTIQLCDHCDPQRGREDADDRKLQEWKDGERAIAGRYRGER
jgi:hypothetical protein